MMKFSYLMAVGTVLGGVLLSSTAMAQANKVWDAIEKGQGYAQKGMQLTQGLDALSSMAEGWPILDFTSVPTHAIVAIEQDFIRMRTDLEDELKLDIKNRLSVEKDKFGNFVDTNLQKVKIDIDQTIAPVKEGLVTVDETLKKAGQTETYKLAVGEQDNLTSSAGSIQSREAYDAKRRYDEQERAIRMLSQAIVLRKSVSEQLPKLVESLQETYDKSDAAKNVKAVGTVTENSDYNKELRQYAYNSLIYDQLLSLEQQLIGLRLQVQGYQKMQGLAPLTDQLDVKK